MDKLRVLSGFEQEPYSINTKGFGKYEETKTLEYNKKSNNYSFFTLIDIYNKHKVKVNNFESDKITLEKNDNEVCINIEENCYLNTDIDKVKVKYDNNILTVVNDSNSLCEHTIYVFKEDNEIITFEFQFTGECIVMYFLKSEYGETFNGILAKIVKNKNDTVVQKYSKLHLPKVINHIVEKDNLKYKFKVDIDYDFVSNIKWFVYMNGAQLYSVTNNCPVFEYSFKEKGEYVVIVSLSDKYFKEFDYFEFDRINI